MPGAKQKAARRAGRREKVAHIRYSQAEFQDVVRAAAAAGMSVSVFLRALSLEGAGVRPFFDPTDRAILDLLGRDIQSVGHALNQLARALNTGSPVDRAHLTGAISDARAVALTVAAELEAMARDADGRQRREDV